MKVLRIVLAGAVAMAGSALVARPALADISPHWAEGGHCLFSDPTFGGTKVGLPSGSGCRPVTSVGVPVARSAARGSGDGYALRLFADTACGTLVATVFRDVPSTTAAAYRLMPIPG